jgi:hypothetical protein
MRQWNRSGAYATLPLHAMQVEKLADRWDRAMRLDPWNAGVVSAVMKGWWAPCLSEYPAALRGRPEPETLGRCARSSLGWLPKRGESGHYWEERITLG